MRVFYARAADNPNYAIAHALASLVEPPERVDLALFRGTHTPLLPRNFRPETEGLANPGLYDLVILAGVDPIVLSPREQLALVGYVERGGGLMLVGGQHAFANAQGTYLLLASILPVRIGRAPDAVVNALPRLEAHPLSRGLPEPLGYVSRAHVVEPKPRAQVAMWAGKRPVVVAGESGAGRVVVVATFPECAESEYGWFFTGDAFDDFMRNAVRWLTRREIPAWIERFSLPKRRLHPGEEGFGKIAVSGAGSAELKVRSRLRRADGQTVREATGPVRPDRKREAIFSFRLPDEPAAAGLHYVVVDLLGPDGVLDRRDVAVEVVNPTRAELDFEHGRRCVRAGGVLRFRAVAISDLRRPPEEVGLEISLVDANGREVIPPRHLSARLGGQRSEPQEMELRLPELRPGPYRLRLETLVAGQRADVTSEEIRIIARHAGERFGVVVGGVWQLDSAAAEDAAAEIAAAGATAAFLKGPAARRWGERRHDEAMSAHAEASALGLGMDVWREVALDAKPGANARDLARTAAPALEALSNLGERAVAWVPFPGGLGPASLARRVAAELRRLRDELAPEVRLATCLDPRLLATGRDEAGMADVLPWAEAFDVLEAGRARERGHSRAVLSYVRTLADALGKSFGAVVETEASYPPPAEAAWAALVEGATHLRVAGNEPWAGTRRERPLREALGGFLSAMTRLGPFLARAERVASPVALIVGPGLDGDGLVAAHGFLCSALGCVDILDWHLLDERALASRKAIAIMGVRTLPRRVVQAIVAFVERGGLLLCDRTEFEDEAGDAVEWPPSFFGTAETAVVEDVSVRRRRFGEGRTVAFTRNLLPAVERAASTGDRRVIATLAEAVAEAAAEHGARAVARTDAPGVEVGVRRLGNSWLVLAVNHGSAPASGDVWLGLEEIRPGAIFDLVSGLEHEPGESGRNFAVSLAPHDGGAWVVYPTRPFGLRLERASGAARVGGELRYSVVVTDSAGAPAAGRHLAWVSFKGPDGAERPGLGGAVLTEDGVAECVARFAANDPPGRWQLRCLEQATRRVVCEEFDLENNNGAR